MARKKTPAPAREVRVRARVSFNGMVVGDEATIPLDGVVQGWINAHLMEVVTTDGESPARPAAADQDNPRGEPDGAGGGGSAGAEPGADLRPG